MKDYESELLEIAIKYHGTQQLREKIQGVVLRIIRDSFKKEYTDEENT